MRAFSFALGFSHLVLLGAIVVSCGRDDGVARVSDKIRSFEPFPLVWLGEEYDPGEEREPMTLRSAGFSVSPAGVAHPEIRKFRIAYGTCDIRPSRDSCTLPLLLDVYGPCAAPPYSAPSIGKIRGVDALSDGDSIWLETAEFTVSVSTAFPVTEGQPPPNDLANAREVVVALFGANDAASHIGRDDDFVPNTPNTC
jgi:hypothetical protein